MYNSHMSELSEVRIMPPLRLVSNDLLLRPYIREREAQFGNRQIDTFAMWFLLSGLPHSRRSNYLIISHPPVESLAKKYELFEPLLPEVASFFDTDKALRPVKTVTLTNTTGNTPLRVLVTGVGKQIDGVARRFIGSDLGVSNKAMKAAVINSVDGWDPTIELGTKPGIIGPFLPRRALENLHGFYYLEDDLSESTPVDIALSDVESLVVTKAVFEEFMYYYQAIVFNSQEYKHIPMTMDR